MIKKEFFIQRKDGVNLYRTYSDSGFKISKFGTSEVYDEAIDIEGADFIYEETKIPIERNDEPQVTEQNAAIGEG